MESATARESLAAAGTARGDGAAEQAVGEAVAGIDGKPSLVLAFPSGIDAKLAAAGAGAAAGSGTPLAGITGNGAIGPDGALEEGCAALAFGPAARVGAGTATGAGADLRRAARTAATEAIAGLGEAIPSLLLLFLDTRSGDQAKAIAGAYEVAGPSIPLAGGAAGGANPAQLSGTRALQDAVVAVAVKIPGPVGIAVAHGCRALGPPSIVTRSRDRLVLELDGEPAAVAYLRNLGFDGIEIDDEQFEALAVTHPLAQPELSGDARIRHVLGREGEALVCATHIPPNAAVQYTHETPEEIIAASGTAVEEAVARLNGREPQAALLFDCAGRKRAVARSLSYELAALLNAFGKRPPPLAGLFTHGEVARVRGAKGDRNHAVVVVTFA